MLPYNWQQKGWPHFTWDEGNIEEELYRFLDKAGRVSGMYAAFPPDVRQEALIGLVVSEAMKTSSIEGEFLSREDVISSVRKNLGILPLTETKDKRVQGISTLMLDVRNTFKDPLSEETLLKWHSLLFTHLKSDETGHWRSHPEPMQVISGAFGNIKVHFEAPPSSAVPAEMCQFIKWFNDTAPGAKSEINKAPVRSAVAHLYFESIHPFSDGNGRIGRAIAEKALSQGLDRPVLLSLSKAIDRDKKSYYSALEKAQHSLELTPWIHYFTKTILAAQTDAEYEIDFTLQKVRFFDLFRNRLNNRQMKAVSRMWEEGPGGFQGGMNARKYKGLCGVSKATATRDLQYLAEIEALAVTGKGRNTSYHLAL